MAEKQADSVMTIDDLAAYFKLSKPAGFFADISRANSLDRDQSISNRTHRLKKT